MTFDKATYTIRFNEPVPVSDWYATEAQDCASSHIAVETRSGEKGQVLIVVVHGNGNIIPMYESSLRERLPDETKVECKVDVGGGDRDLVQNP